jgi:SnoaL-like domain
VTARLAVAALALLAACALGCAHGGRGAGAKPGEVCSAECPMHAEEHGAGGARGHGGGAHAPGGGMSGGMHDAHAARHAAIDRLVAIEDIQQLKARYMRCIDTRDLACLRDTVFTPETELYFKGGEYEISVKGWPEIEKFYQGAFTPEKFGMHNVHTPEISVSGDTATGTWYLHDVFVNLEESTTLQGSALYHDEYVKRNGEWRIARSTYARLWEETTPRSPKTKLGSKPVKE